MSDIWHPTSSNKQAHLITAQSLSLLSNWQAHREDQQRAHKRLQRLCGNGIAYFIFASFAYFHLSPFLTSILHYALGLSGTFILLQRFLKFNRWDDELPHAPSFFLALAIALAELVAENFFVWVVAALDDRKYQLTPALQDNILKYMLPMTNSSPVVHHMLYFPYADALKFLFWAIALPLSVLWNQVPYSGFAMMTRYLLTLACSRSIRVVCFLVTILPSPRPGCYARRFPPVPGTLREFLSEGFSKMRGFGGCNDLIFSGHGGFWTLTVLLFQTYYHGRGPFGRGIHAFLMLLLLQTSIRDVMDEQHYSVDMVLAVVVTSAVWTWLQWVYPPSQIIASIHDKRKAQRTPVVVVVLVFGSIFIGLIIIVIGRA